MKYTISSLEWTKEIDFDDSGISDKWEAALQATASLIKTPELFSESDDLRVNLKVSREDSPECLTLFVPDVLRAAGYSEAADLIERQVEVFAASLD
tara:strand:- start:498 stop:785 length:288 start_codon:yes stop_codon:yes gene_type:complete